MLLVALFIGVFSYVVFTAGVLGLFDTYFFKSICFISLISLILIIYFQIKKVNWYSKVELSELPAIFLILLIGLVTLIGALLPELAFDALWYHLTIPKIFISEGGMPFIKGGIFYYSLMPMLTEMIYLPLIMYGGEIYAKLAHFFFGVLTAMAIYKIVRIYLSRNWALIGVLVFTSSLVVSWLMTTAYSDLSRSFFETLALYYFLIFTKSNKKKHLLTSAILVGLAVSTKLVSLGSILVFLTLLLMYQKFTSNFFKCLFLFALPSISIASPWFIRAFFYTGNPVYPLFSELGLSGSTFDLINPVTFVKTFIDTFLFSADPINPLFFMLVPMFVFVGKKFYLKNIYLITYIAISYLVWYFFFQEGGSRFLTSYFGAYIAVSLLLISRLHLPMRKILIVTVFLISAISLVYRGASHLRAWPYLLGIENKENFLLKRLNFEFGDFYDENEDIKKIAGSDLVLIQNIHNLYYVDFNFTISEWENASDAKYKLVYDRYTVDNISEPLYINKKTHVKLYKL